MLVTVITDASWCPDTGAAGYGYWVACDRGRRNGQGTMKGTVTSSLIAEMMAMVNGVYHAVRTGMVLNGDSLLVQTDCQAAIDTFTGMRQPQNPVEVEVVTRMLALSNSGRLRVNYRHVKGHTRGTTPRTFVNIFCDNGAKEEMRKRRHQLKQAGASQEEQP